MIAPIASSHSALVTMELRTGGVCAPVAQLAHDFAILAESIDLPPCEAEIVLTVDGQTTCMPVSLREGASTASRRIELERVAIPVK